MPDAETSQGSPFWRFSLRFYRLPGVADACIALQDQCGADVNVLLFFLWLATARRCISATMARMVCARVAPWRDNIVAPLRMIRRRLKEETPVDRDAAEAFRARVKAIELESEWLQQEALFALAAGLATEDAASMEAAARANVAAYEHALGRTLAPAAIASLVNALAACPG